MAGGFTLGGEAEGTGAVGDGFGAEVHVGKGVEVDVSAEAGEGLRVGLEGDDGAGGADELGEEEGGEADVGADVGDGHTGPDDGAEGVDDVFFVVVLEPEEVGGVVVDGHFQAAIGAGGDGDDHLTVSGGGAFEDAGEGFVEGGVAVDPLTEGCGDDAGEFDGEAADHRLAPEGCMVVREYSRGRESGKAGEARMATCT